MSEKLPFLKFETDFPLRVLPCVAFWWRYGAFQENCEEIILCGCAAFVSGCILLLVFRCQMSQQQFDKLLLCSHTNQYAESTRRGRRRKKRNAWLAIRLSFLHCWPCLCVIWAIWLINSDIRTPHLQWFIHSLGGSIESQQSEEKSNATLLHGSLPLLRITCPFN